MAYPKVKTKDLITPGLAKLGTALQTPLYKKAHKYFREETPISDPRPGHRPGNARRKTRRRGHIIVANYKYAEKLDKGGYNYNPKSGKTTPQGYSTQARKGIVQPTIDRLEELIKRVVRRYGR